MINANDTPRAQAAGAAAGPADPIGKPLGKPLDKPLAKPLAKTIALVGLMGAGKTAIGRRLATRLGVPFRDADAEVERAAAMTIPEIFDTFGEPYFRDGERRVIARLLSDPPHVLATGGGAFMDPETRKTMAAQAVTVWLKADIETLLARVTRRDTRPLLRQGDPRGILEALIEKRYPIYAEADVTVASLDAPHEESLDAVLAALEEAGALAGALEAPDAPGAAR